jgi:predicted ribosome quality control (RQC) complex YloA/Tae2 family protein
LPEKLSESFFEVIEMIKGNKYVPSIVYKNDSPVEYAFCELLHYGNGFEVKKFESVGKMLDAFYDGRDREVRVKQFASDLLKILNNAEARITKKLELQRGELAECEKGEEYKRMGDMITANIYLLKRGMKSVELTDYSEQLEDGSFAACTVELDERLSPAANAQRMYKRYNKSKSAKINLTRQIELGESEAEYISSVFDSLSRAETPTDLAEIREELYRSGYASKMKSYVKSKTPKSTIMEYRTSGGYRVLCGKNNIQNEQITFKLAEKSDYWFHAKNVPGSHVVMVCEGEEPDAKDFTEAAEIAALNSKAEGENVAVDYAFAKSIKKPAGAKPGFVIYHTNWTAYVTPNREKVEKMRIK